jgi:hypothetical protein
MISTFSSLTELAQFEPIPREYGEGLGLSFRDGGRSLAQSRVLN